MDNDLIQGHDCKRKNKVSRKKNGKQVAFEERNIMADVELFMDVLQDMCCKPKNALATSTYCAEIKGATEVLATRHGNNRICSSLLQVCNQNQSIKVPSNYQTNHKLLHSANKSEAADGIAAKSDIALIKQDKRLDKTGEGLLQDRLISNQVKKLHWNNPDSNSDKENHNPNQPSSLIVSPPLIDTLSRPFSSITDHLRILIDYLSDCISGESDQKDKEKIDCKSVNQLLMTPIHSYNYTGNEGTLGPNTGNSHGPPPSRSIVECPRSSPPRKYQWISENIQAAIQPNDIERKRASFSEAETAAKRPHIEDETSNCSLNEDVANMPDLDSLAQLENSIITVLPNKSGLSGSGFSSDTQTASSKSRENIQNSLQASQQSSGVATGGMLPNQNYKSENSDKSLHFSPDPVIESSSTSTSSQLQSSPYLDSLVFPENIFNIEGMEEASQTAVFQQQILQMVRHQQQLQHQLGSLLDEGAYHRNGTLNNTINAYQRNFSRTAPSEAMRTLHSPQQYMHQKIGHALQQSLPQTDVAPHMDFQHLSTQIYPQMDSKTLHAQQQDIYAHYSNAFQFLQARSSPQQAPLQSAHLYAAYAPPNQQYINTQQANQRHQPFARIPAISDRRNMQQQMHHQNLSPAKSCFNCGSVSTPSWRRCPRGKQLLCNACGLYAKLHNKPRPFKVGEDGSIRVQRVVSNPVANRGRASVQHTGTCENVCRGKSNILSEDSDQEHLARNTIPQEMIILCQHCKITPVKISNFRGHHQVLCEVCALTSSLHLCTGAGSQDQNTGHDDNGDDIVTNNQTTTDDISNGGSVSPLLF